MHLSLSRLSAMLDQPLHTENHPVGVVVTCLAVLAIFLFGVGGMVANSTAVLTNAESLAGAAVLLLIVVGLLVTIFEMENRHGPNHHA